MGGEYHGKSGTKVAMDGMGVENSFGNSSYQINAAAVSEMVLQTTGISADTNADGAVVNVIPKEGGNTFSGILAGFYAGDAMESQNLTQELKDAGLTTSNSTLKLWDQSLSIGGPVARDRLWFFIAGRSWGFSRAHAGVYWNQNTFPGAPPTGEPRYLTPPGADRKVVNFTPYESMPPNRYSGRLEWYDSYLSRITMAGVDRTRSSTSPMTSSAPATAARPTRSTGCRRPAPGYRFDPNRLIQFLVDVDADQPTATRSRIYGGNLAVESVFLMPGVDAGHDVRVQSIQGLGIRYGNSGSAVSR